jgi:Flp pilus assembly protein TadD
VIWFYLFKLVWPVPLIFVYPRWAISAAVWWQYLFPLAAVGLTAGLWALRRRGRGPLAALLFYLGTLFPVLGFLNVYPFRYSFVADHFQYLAGLGPLTLLGAGATLAWRRYGSRLRGLGPVPGAVVLLALAGLTWRQCAMYTDIETLWRTTLARNPGCWIAHNDLGFALYQVGRSAEAKEQYEEALQLKPDYAEAHGNLGAALLKTGQTAEALHQFELAVKLKPHDDLVHYNLGIAYLQVGQVPEATAQFEQALKIKPDDAEAHSNLGAIFAQTGRFPEAVEQFEEAVKMDPGYADGRYNLGATFMQEGRAAEAIEQFEQALKIDPDNAKAHNNLGISYYEVGRMPEARAQFEEALRLDPNFVEARNNLIKIQAPAPAAPAKN